MNTILKKLSDRGLVSQVTNKDPFEDDKKQLKVYVGFDATAPALHVGNLLALNVARWFLDSGHHVYLLLGGATTLIGDPSGKDKERQFLSPKKIEDNIKLLQDYLLTHVSGSNKSDSITFVNNMDWYGKMTMVGFLRDVCKDFRVGYMMSKESVKKRINSEQGISLTEFCYQVLQGYDFHYLNQTHNVDVQIGGDDQWGNITSGCEFNRKQSGSDVYGLTFPLLTRSDGKKFGKSEKGAIWLNSELTSVYDFYQYFLTVSDDDVEKYLYMLTFLDVDTIKNIIAQRKAGAIEPNEAQRILARELTLLVHGNDSLETVLQQTAVKQPGKLQDITYDDLQSIVSDSDPFKIKRPEWLDYKLIDLFVETSLSKSKSEARKLIKGGGAYINNKRIDDIDYVVTIHNFLSEQLLLLGAGKKKKRIVQIND
jgi:tyrosyl-tRNA synthetase